MTTNHEDGLGDSLPGPLISFTCSYFCMATFHLGLWPLFRAFLGGLVKGCLGLAEMQMFLMLWEGKTHGTKVWGRSWRRFWLSCSKKAGHSAFSPWLLGDAVFLSLLVYSHAGESGAWLWIWFASIAASAGPREICKGWLEDDRGPRNNQDTWQQMPKACTCLQWRSDWTIGRLSSEAEDSTHGCPHARSEGQPGGAANVDRSSLQEVPKNPPQGSYNSITIPVIRWWVFWTLQIQVRHW